VATSTSRPASSVALMKVLADFISFLTTQSNNTDPFSREGVPITSHQKIFGDVALVETIVSIATLGKGQAVDISVLVWKLIRHIVRGYSKTGTSFFYALSLKQFVKASDKEVSEFLGLMSHFLVSSLIIISNTKSQSQIPFWKFFEITKCCFNLFLQILCMTF